tara:strand:+ start:879 stop:1082 length:204 start_codon:yes stop_codon:yes gene_type:complete
MTLTKAQKKEIAQRGWVTFNEPYFVGANWYDKGENVVCQMADVSEEVAELVDECDGVDFLIVAYRAS